MTQGQLDLFKRKASVGLLQPQVVATTSPTGESKILSTLPAYYAYLQSGGYAKHTPDQFTSDVKSLGGFLQEKKIQEVQIRDLQGWISELRTNKYKNYSSKTIS